MSWSWSHTNEAYAYAQAALEKQSMKFLKECYAEWKCHDIKQAEKRFDEELFELDVENVPDIPKELTTNPFLDGRYEHFVEEAQKIIKEQGKEWIALEIWDQASGQATCDNGGWNAWMCPSGCHTVPFGPKSQTRKR